MEMLNREPPLQVGLGALGSTRPQTKAQNMVSLERAGSKGIWKGWGQVTEKALILRHLVQVKKQPGYNLLDTLCVQSRCLRLWQQKTILWTAYQRATIEMLWPATPFTLKCNWKPTNWTSKQKQNLSCFQISFLLKCNSNIKEKHAIPWSVC